MLVLLQNCSTGANNRRRRRRRSDSDSQGTTVSDMATVSSMPINVRLDRGENRPLLRPLIWSPDVPHPDVETLRGSTFSRLSRLKNDCFGTCCAVCLGELCCYFCLVPGRSCPGGGDQQRGGCLGGRGGRRRRLFYPGGFHCVLHEKKQQDFILLIIQNCIRAERLVHKRKNSFTHYLCLICLRDMKD